MKKIIQQKFDQCDEATLAIRADDILI